MSSDISLNISGSNPGYDVTLSIGDKFIVNESPVTNVTNVTNETNQTIISGNSVMTVAELRASTGLHADQSVTTKDFGGGTWTYAGLNDGNYTDDTATTIITADNKVWLRAFNGEVNASWFGLSTSATRASNTTSLQSAINILYTLGGGEIKINKGKYLLNKITLRDKVSVIGQGIGHASVYFTASNKEKGTVLLIDGQAGDDCVVFESNTSFTGFTNISIYNDNANAIRAVVHIPGVLYPIMQNVEISSRLHATGTIGLLLSANTTSPNWETLYGSYVNVTVITNEAVGVYIGLKLLGLSPTLRPNASRFLGGHFQGYCLSLLIDGAQPNSAPQGIAFLGTAFESYYNSEQQKIYVPNSSGMQAFVEDQDRYAVIWMYLKQCNQVSFFGCYLEDGGNTFTWDDGTHGVKHAFPCMWIGAEAIQTVILGNTLVAGVFDQGFGTTHPNKLSMLDQNSVVSFEGYGIVAQSGQPASSEARIAVDNISNLRVRKNTVLIATNEDSGVAGEKLQVGGDIRALQYKHLHTDDDIVALKIGGSKIRLQNQNNEVAIEGRAIGGFSAHMFFLAEGNEVMELAPALVHIFQRVTIDQALKAETPAPEIADNTVVTAEWVNSKNFSTAPEIIAGNSTALVAVGNKNAISIKALPVYTNDAAADADTNLTSLSLYKLASGRGVYQKP